MTSIIGVHGIGNHLAGHPPTTAARHLAGVWRTALGQGLGAGHATTPVTVAYYAHRLRPTGQQADTANIDQLDPQAQTMIWHWLEQHAVTPGVAQGRLTAGLRQEIAGLARRLGHHPEATEQFAAWFFGEVSRYLHGDGFARHLVRTEIANTIAAAAPPRIVIAHSLGSVAAYETLHAYPHLTVDLLITLGSPLACAPVFQALDPPPADRRGRRPRAAQRWINIADRGDLVAIPAHGIRDRFDGLTADIQTSIHWADFHTVANYLKTPELARVLLDILV